jgi:uncharacterized protein (DUF2236 family)
MSIADWVSEAPVRLRERVGRGIRHAAGLSEDPPPICDDPAEAYQSVDAVARLVHGDLSSMMIGGLASLFFEMLHPLTMSGVAQHSRYREDPLGRVLRTANFIGATTYGSTARASAAIERVRSIHEGVRGVADDGREYRASDPELLEWIHCAGTSMFLRAYQAFGAQTLSDADADRYVADVVRVARDLGAVDVPSTVADLDARLEAFRPQLRLSPVGAQARDFILRGVVRGPHQRAAYRLLVASGLGLLEPWARDLLGVPTRPVRHALVVTPANHVLARTIRLAVPPVTMARSHPRSPDRDTNTDRHPLTNS